MCILIVRLLRSTYDVLICFEVGVANPRLLFRTDAFRWAVTDFRLRVRAVQLNQLGVINILAKVCINGGQIRGMAVAG